MLRKLVVEKRIIRGPQVESIVILANLILKEQPRLSLKVLPQSLVGALHFIEPVPQRPSYEETGHQIARFRILQHSPDLLFEACGLSKIAFFYGVHQSGVW